MFKIGIQLCDLALKFRGRSLLTNIEFFLASNSISNGIPNPQIGSKGTLGLCFVATDKDFPILVHSIKFAVEAVPGFNLKNCSVIVPDRSLQLARELLQKSLSVSIIPESDVVPLQHLEELRSSWGNRANWIYQQLLKVKFVRDSSTDYCLVVDADTLLLNPRDWVDSSGRIGFTPTDEENRDYYDFLTRISVISDYPTYSFVPHHMFYKTNVFNNMLRDLNIYEIGDLISKIKANSNTDSRSPISIDYELFGQWAVRNIPNDAYLMKWSNVAFSRGRANEIILSSARLKILSKLYNSLSFHDYS